MKLRKVGTKIYKTAKQGGGEQIVIGHINCSRCNELNELLEQTYPSNAQRKKRGYAPEFTICKTCGLYEKGARPYINI